MIGLFKKLYLWLTESKAERRHRKRSPHDLDVDGLPKGDLNCDHTPGHPYPDSSCRCLECGRFFAGNYGGSYQLKKRMIETHQIELTCGYVSIAEIEWYIEEGYIDVEDVSEM